MNTGDEWLILAVGFGIIIPMVVFVIYFEIKERKKERIQEEINKIRIKENKMIEEMYDLLHSYKREDAVKRSIRECQIVIRKINREFSNSEEKIDKEWIKRMNLKREQAEKVFEKYKEFEGQKKDIVQKEVVEVFCYIHEEIKEKLDTIIENKYREELEKIKEKKKEIQKI